MCRIVGCCTSQTDAPDVPYEVVPEQPMIGGTTAHPGSQARRPAGPGRATPLGVLPLHGARPAGRQAGGLRAPVRSRAHRCSAGKSWLIGRPLANEEEIGERLTKKLALPIFSSDAISSSAYATEEILRVLVLAGAGALFLSIEVAIAISVLLAVVAISYRQVCHAFPSGGGAYMVARQELSADRWASWPRPPCSSTTS